MDASWKIDRENKILNKEKKEKKKKEVVSHACEREGEWVVGCIEHTGHWQSSMVGEMRQTTGDV